MAKMTLMLGLLASVILWDSAVCAPLVFLEKKSDTFIPLPNGTFQFNSRVSKTISYDPESRIIYSTGLTTIDDFKLNRDLTTEIISGPVSPEEDIIFDTIQVCNGFVIVAGGIRDSRDATVQIYKRMQTKSKWNKEITYELRRSIRVGDGPLSLEVTKDCRRILVTSGGEEPDTELREGYVTMISWASSHFGPYYRTTVMDFSAFEDMNAELISRGLIRIKPNTTLSQDLIPNDIVLDKAERYAYVTLLKNNAVAVVDIRRKIISDLIPLGYKDHNVTGSGFDGSMFDGGAQIKTWPVVGLFEPNGICTVNIDDRTYLITGNQGMSTRVKVDTLTLDPVIFPNALELQLGENIGKLIVETFNADRDGDGDIDVLQAQGARSISLWSSDGMELIADTGDDIERATANLNLAWFNTNNNNGDVPILLEFDAQSPKRGPEPGSVVSMSICRNRYEMVFVANQRPGSIAVFTLNRQSLSSGFTFQSLWSDEQLTEADLSGFITWNEAYEQRKITMIDPRQIIIVKARDSPSGKPLLMAASYDSGTISVFEINVDCSGLLRSRG